MAEPHGPQGPRRSEHARRSPDGSPRSVRSYRSPRRLDPIIGWWMLLRVPRRRRGAARRRHPRQRHWIYFLHHRHAPRRPRRDDRLSRRAERAAYRQIEGQPGAAGAALSLDPPRLVHRPRAGRRRRRSAPATCSSAAMVYRASAAPASSSSARARRPASRSCSRPSEAGRARRPRRPGHDVRVGDAARARSRCRKLAQHGAAAEAASSPRTRWLGVNKRLKALGGIRAAAAARASTRCAPAWTARPCAASDPPPRQHARIRRPGTDCSVRAAALRLSRQRVRTMTVPAPCRAARARRGPRRRAGMKRQAGRCAPAPAAGTDAAAAERTHLQAHEAVADGEADRADEQQVHDARRSPSDDEALAAGRRRLRERQRHPEEPRAISDGDAPSR